MNEEIFNELQERIDETERALYTTTINTKEFYVLKNQLATMKILRELFNLEVTKDGKENKNPKG